MRDPADVIAQFLMEHAIPSSVAFRWAPDLLAALRAEYGTTIAPVETSVTHPYLPNRAYVTTRKKRVVPVPAVEEDRDGA